jgi:hypothetical protein
MSLFLVCALPLSFLLAQTLYEPWIRDRREALGSFFWGVLAFLPGLVVYLLFSGGLRLEFSPARIFLYFLIRDYLFWLALALLCYGLFFRAELVSPVQKASRFLAFLAGFFLLAGFLDLVLNFSGMDSYVLFLLPLNRLGLLILAALGMGFIGSRTEGAAQLALFPLVLLAGLPAGLTAFLYHTSHPIWAWILSPLFLLASAAGLAFSLRRD